MSSADFDASLTQVSGGRNGLAPAIWAATTEDDLVAITAAGYMTDLVGDNNNQVRSGDWMFVSYDATSRDPDTPPSSLMVITQALTVYSLTEKLSS